MIVRRKTIRRNKGPNRQVIRYSKLLKKKHLKRYKRKRIKFLVKTYHKEKSSGSKSSPGSLLQRDISLSQDVIHIRMNSLLKGT
jgi:hypothetical protein